MGKNHITTYDTFTWRPGVEAIAADADRGIEAREAIPHEDKYNVDHVFAKFDEHFGVHRYRSIKRQEFLKTTRGSNQSVMSFIVELKKKAEYCDYGEKKDSFICDMVINKINDSRCTERLMELPDCELSLDNVIRICRQVELTKSHVNSLNKSNNETQVHQTQRSRGRGRGYGRRNQRQFTSQGYQDNSPPCKRCCRHHDRGYCKAYDQFCGRCGERGHFKKYPLRTYNHKNNVHRQGNGPSEK